MKKSYMRSEESELEQLYQNVSSKSIKRRIFKLHNSEHKDPQYVYQNLKDTYFLKNSLGLRQMSVPFVARTYQKGSRFFRARKLNIEEQKQLSNDDFWEAPSHFINSIPYGRANYPKQPLLYLSASDLITPELEIGIKEEDHFIIIGYLVENDITLNTVGCDRNKALCLSSSTRKKMRLFEKSIRDIFLSKSESAYITSSVLSNEILTKINKSDGVCYPSQKNINGINICLFKGYKENLNIDVLFYCKKQHNKTLIQSIFTIENEQFTQRLDDWSEANSKAQIFLDLFAADSGKINITKSPIEQEFPLDFVD